MTTKIVLLLATKDDFTIFCKSPGVLIFFFCASTIILFIIKFLTGLSASILVITTPVVSFGNFLFSISSSFKGLTSIFKSSITVVFKTFGFFGLKSLDVSNLPNLIFLKISF